MTEFRNDIQLLRGVAILAVLAYHIRPDLLPGGFLGVDLFFVVSGYLMGALYDPTTIKGAIDFLQRRARRILPAYYAVLLASVFIATAMVLPHQLATLDLHALYAATLLPNFGFWLDESYFSKAEFKPFLHLWSLGVEVQFYALFPLLALLYKWRGWSLLAVIVLSFAACLGAMAISPKTAFFLTPFRLWEFGVGILGAKLVAERHWLAIAASRHKGLSVGAFAILTLLFVINVPESHHPGAAALAVTVLSGLILVAGLPAWITASRPGRAGVVLGTYSYSVYLVHFPIIQFAFYTAFEGNTAHLPSALESLGLLVAIAIASLLLFHLVEQPFRGSRRSSRLWMPTLGAGAMVLLLAVAGPPLQRTLYSPEELRILDAWQDRADYRCGKLARLTAPWDRSCELAAAQDGQPTYLLVGNSHADAIKTALAAAAQRNGAGLRLMTQNCALAEGACGLASVNAELRRWNAAGVILHSSPGSADIGAAGALERLVNDKTRIVFIEPVPVWPAPVPKVMYAKLTGFATLPDMNQDLSKVRAAADFRRDGESSRIEVVNIAEIFCTPSCSYARAGKPLYFDSNHLTLTGAALLEPIFDGIFAKESWRGMPDQAK